MGIEVLTGREQLIKKRQEGERLVVFVSGISGSGRLDYLKTQQEVAEANDRKFEILDVVDFLKDVYASQNQMFPGPEILNVSQRELEDKVKTAYHEISRIIKGNKKTDYIVTGHVSFLWDKMMKIGFHPDFFNKINPDLFVSILKNEYDVLNTLNGLELGEDGQPTKRSLKYAEQWARQDFSAEEIISWMSNEFVLTKHEADRHNKAWFACNRFMAPTTFFMAMYYPERPWIYYMQQMTHALTDGSYTESDEIFNQLMQRGTIFNPKGYEIYNLDNDSMSARFTKIRDKDWFCRQADLGIAYYHYPEINDKIDKIINMLSFVTDEDQREKIISALDSLKRKGALPSEGMAAECAEMFNSGKPVFRIWPPNIETGGIYCSPFVWSSSTMVLPGIGRFFNEFDKRYGGSLDIVIPEKVLTDAYKPSLANRGNIPKNYVGG